MSLRYLSLFSGIGGFEVGIHNVYGDRAKCVGYSEIDKNALKVYQKHFPDHKLLGPVEKVDGREFEGIDLLVAGSPCQNLSSSNIKTRWGKALPPGLKGEKSKLFYEFLRILQKSNPQYFILENVASMKNVDRDKITELLGVEPIEINSNLFTPQNRKRLFWTNIKLREEDKQLLKSAKPRIHMKDILVSIEEAKKLIVNPNESKIYQSYIKKKEKYGSVIRMAVVDSDDDDLSPALLSGRVMWIRDKRINKYRKFAPQELEALQSFPKDWTSGISYTNQSKVLGNAVTCDVVSFLIECLKRNT